MLLCVGGYLRDEGAVDLWDDRSPSPRIEGGLKPKAVSCLPSKNHAKVQAGKPGRLGKDPALTSVSVYTGRTVTRLDRSGELFSTFVYV